MELTVNGQVRVLAEVEEGAGLNQVLESLGFRADRVAVEVNGTIARRSAWGTLTMRTGDRLEVVHFVGGGYTAEASSDWIT